ncbi:MAG: hypothetical protein JXA30_22205 [Deltaproteobacteria bacterium]|nr:hypothetical protein [Deltaproteobacteria bacterium]
MEGLISAICRVLRECGGGESASYIWVTLQTPQRCEIALPYLLDYGDKYGLLSLTSNERIDFNSDEAQNCLSFLTDKCFYPDEMLNTSACKNVFQGTIAIGEQCYRDEECSGDAYCDPIGGCLGECKPRLKPGVDCEREDNQCTTGSADFAICDDGQCRQITISAPAGENESCSRGPNAFTFCQSGLWCSEAEGGCRHPIAIGQPCPGDNDLCEQGSTCVYSDNSYTCQPYELLKVGAACETTNKLRVCDPIEGLFCTPDGCKELGDGSEGSSCSTTELGDIFSCSSGLYCDSDTTKCAKQKSGGEPCGRGYECLSGECDSNDTCTDRHCGG